CRFRNKAIEKFLAESNPYMRRSVLTQNIYRVFDAEMTAIGIKADKRRLSRIVDRSRIYGGAGKTVISGVLHDGITIGNFIHADFLIHIGSGSIAPGKTRIRKNQHCRVWCFRKCETQAGRYNLKVEARVRLAKGVSSYGS